MQMQRIFTAFCLTVFLQSAVIAQEPINTDRPDQTDGTYTLPAKKFQIEAGLVINDSSFSQNAMFRYGISKSIEVRLLTNYGVATHAPKDFIFDPVGISSKQKIYKGCGYIPQVTTVEYVWLPSSASKNVRPDKIPTSVLIALQSDFTKNISLDYNGGILFPANDNNTNWIFTASLGINLSEKSSLFCEYFARFATAESPDNDVDAGFLYLINNHLQIDVAFGSSTRFKRNNDFASTGISYLFGKWDVMIHITQLIYIKEGQEGVFDQFESVAIPLIAKYNGRLLLRVRPDRNSIIEHSIDKPYEIHLVEFDSEEGFNSFKEDEERKKFLHLKEQSIKASILIQGTKL